MQLAQLLAACLVAQCACASSDSQRPKISHVSLLLPTEKSKALDGTKPISVSKRVQATPGCFEWISSDPSLITVEIDKDDNCLDGFSSGVTLYSISNSTVTKSCEVLAFQHADTGGEEENSLNVEVYTGRMERIEILTTVRRLALYEAETLIVQAFDNKGNVFSSLNGLSFIWQSSDADRGNEEASPVLIRKITESELSDTRGLEQEFYGHFGYKVQVIGRRTGRALISAELLQIDTGRVIKTEVIIDVVEPLKLCPSGPIMIPGVDVGVHALRKVNRHTFREISGDDRNRYEFVVSGTDGVVSIDSERGIVSAHTVGRSGITFREKGYEVNRVSAPIRVVDPTDLKLWFTPVTLEGNKLGSDPLDCEWLTAARFPLHRKLPHYKEWTGMDQKRWIWTLGKRYYVMATIAADGLNDTQMVFITPDMAFEFTHAWGDLAKQHELKGDVAFLGREHEPFTLANNVRIVEGQHVGFLDLSATFANFATTQREIQITSPIALRKHLIRLPIDATGKVFHSYAVEALGGTGYFEYAIEPSKDEECTERCCGDDLEADYKITVEQHLGVARVHRQVQSNQTVLVTDKFDHFNVARASVLVSRPSSIEFKEEILYVSIGETFPLAVYLLDMEGERYDNCTGFLSTIQWGVHGGHVEAGKRTQKQARAKDGSMCSFNQYFARSPGSTTITAQYDENLIASIKIIVLERVHIVQPVPNLALERRGLPAALISIGTSTTLKVAGGQREDTFSIARRGRDEENWKVLSKTEAAKYVDVKFKQRDPKKTRFYKLVCCGDGVEEGDYEITVQGHAKMVLLCRAPAEARILLVDQNYDDEGCSSLNSHEDKRQTMFVVNNQELTFQVQLFDRKGQAFTDTSDFKVSWDGDGNAKTTWRPLQSDMEKRALFIFPDVADSTIISATYRHIERTDEVYVAELILNIQNDLSFDHNHALSIVADPDVEFQTSVSGGSDELLSNLECAVSSKDAILMMNNRFGTIQYGRTSESPNDFDVKLSCSMSCLVGSSGASVTLPFMHVTRLGIQAPGKVREGSELDVFVRAYDRSGGVFTRQMHGYVHPTLSTLPDGSIELPGTIDHAICKDESDTSQVCDGMWKIPVKAARAGDVVVQASTMSGGILIEAEQKIRIYKGLVIIPGFDKTIEPGVKFRLRRAHGPFADPSTCRFECSDDHVVQILDEKHGSFHALKRGDVTIRAVCREHGKIIDEAKIDIKIKYFSEMVLVPEISHVIVGQGIRVRVGFPEMKERLIDFDTIHRTFVWSIDNATIASVVGAETNTEHSIWFKGLQPGETVIRVTSISPHAGSPKLEASARIIVEKKLELMTPREVLMPRRGRFDVKTTLDGSDGILSFTVCKKCGPFLPMQVAENGVVTSGDETGSAAIEIVYESRSSDDDVFVQRIFMMVVVSEVAFVGVSQPWNDLVIPLDTTRPAVISLYDIQGNKFTSPFSTLQVEANVSNEDVLAITDQVVAEIPSQVSLHLKGISLGHTNIVVSLKGSFKEDSREEYIRVIVVEPSQGLQFDLANATNNEGRIPLVAGRLVKIPLKSLVYSDLSSQGIACSVAMGETFFETEITASQETDGLGLTWYCTISVPKHLSRLENQADTNLRLVLSVSNHDIVRTEVPALFGFHLSSENVEIDENESIDWKDNLKEITVRVSGDSANEVLAMSSDPTLVTVETLSSSRSRTEFRLMRPRNDTCGETTRVSFTHTKTEQVIVLRVHFPCDSGSSYSSLFKDLHLQTIIVASVVLFLVLVWFCGGPRYREPVGYNEMDRINSVHRAYPRLSREQDLGSPLRMRRNIPRSGTPLL
mmetsp:Transcript_32246/g.51387  ORF Transcript_32246/g.51387 Transcript_32246/m.51387 type:complete len:1810 (+) Transcript_32246:155-5584(+)